MATSYRRAIKLLSIGLALVLILSVAGTAAAHPADMFFQSYSLDLTAKNIQLTWAIVPGPMIVPMLWGDADKDHNGQVSPAEAQTWVVPSLGQLTASVNDTPLPWQVVSVEWPASQEKFQVGDEKIVVHLTAAWPSHGTGPAQLEVHNQYQEPITINWFSLQGDNGVTFQTPQQTNGALQVAVVMPGEMQANSAAKTLLNYWDSGTPSLETAAAKTIGLTDLTQKATGAAQPQDPRPAAMLTNLMRSGQLSGGFFFLALAIAGVLGSLHALTPGHGKTIVAAYLVGTRGTTRHAVSLGAIVTLTHTGSVFALGLVTLAASQYILPTSLFPVLEIASGLLIVGLGAYLLYGRWRAWRAGETSHDHPHDHDPSHHHHDHPHDHDHSQHPHDHPHHLPDATGVTWRSLITLGVSGGLVPCPDAIAILLVAIAINRIALGLSLIVAFSLGLALVLIVIGLVLVHSRRLVERLDTFNRLAPLMPLVSAAIVLLLGLGLTYNAVRSTEVKAFTQEGAADTSPQALSGSPAGPFQLDQARMLYLAQDQQNRLQLAVRRLSESQPTFLTQTPGGIQSYVLSPDKTTLIYMAPHNDGTTELWKMNTDGSHENQILTCPKSLCRGVAWSPDGQHLVYEKDDLPSPDNLLGLPSLWWLDIATGQTHPLFPNSQWPGSSPGWSPDGQWLSYTSSGRNQLEIYNLKDGRRYTIPGQTDGNVAWQPDSRTLLVEDLQIQDAKFFIHLLRFDLRSGKSVDLSAGANPVDTGAAWSPDGQWIALLRREASNPDPAKDLQLWVMHADGSQARRLTDQTDALYGALNWSPDGHYLLFHQYVLKKQRDPQIWLLNVQTGELQLIASPGYWPAWLP